MDVSKCVIMFMAAMFALVNLGFILLIIVSPALVSCLKSKLSLALIYHQLERTYDDRLT